MSKMFKRVAKVLVASTVEGEGIVISDLRIQFDIRNTIQTEPNEAKIVINNLSFHNRSRIQEKDWFVSLMAGYEGMEEVIFRGVITNIAHKRNPPDIETIIEAQDGLKQLKGSKISKSFGAGSNLKHILKSVADNLNLPFKIPVDQLPIPDVRLNAGESFCGTTKTALDKVSRMAGLIWSVQNGELTFHPINNSFDRGIIVISPETGLIGSPEKIVITNSDKEQRGWAVKSLLQPSLVSGSRVSIRSSDIPENSFFRVESVDHSGDTHGNEWCSSMEVVQI